MRQFLQLKTENCKLKTSAKWERPPCRDAAAARLLFHRILNTEYRAPPYATRSARGMLCCSFFSKKRHRGTKSATHSRRIQSTFYVD
ncbi:MAG: hypothetical protein NTV22_03455, partial [bacterium]|nr:hypothetical protein [bacterium]